VGRGVRDRGNAPVRASIDVGVLAALPPSPQR
jgi:hypothetical protein